MNASAAHRLDWHARRLIRAVGWPGIAAVALVILGVVFHFQEVMPLRERLVEVRHEANDLRAKVAARGTVSRAADPAGQLAAFYEFFPDGDAMADTLDRLHVAAAQENLVLEQGEYRLAPESMGRLMRYDIVLPVKGPYPHLRRFIARALRENPSLALEGVSFNRQAAMTIGVDAQVRMTLYFRGTQ
ncbi:MAG: hypothetical protein PHX38_11130 [Sulfuricella sp.]|nr:hypothetical protein [Sulfuricella sp.]